jgi:hypothetical protein
MTKTNAIRFLESHKINFTSFSYEVDESDLSGETVAKKKLKLNRKQFSKLSFALAIKPDTWYFAFLWIQN